MNKWFFFLSSSTWTVVSDNTTLYAEICCALTFYLECSLLFINPSVAVDTHFGLYKTIICRRFNYYLFILHHFTEFLTGTVIVLVRGVLDLDGYSTTETKLVFATITREYWVFRISNKCLCTFNVWTIALLLSRLTLKPSWDIHCRHRKHRLTCWLDLWETRLAQICDSS